MVAYKISYNDVITLLDLPPDTTVDKLDELFSFAKCEIEEYDLEDEGYINKATAANSHILIGLLSH